MYEVCYRNVPKRAETVWAQKRSETVPFRHVSSTFLAHLPPPANETCRNAMAHRRPLCPCRVSVMSTTDGGSITLETAFSLGTLVVNKSGAVACMCAPGTHYKPGWAGLEPPSGEHTKPGNGKVHQDWARAQRGKRKLELPLKREASGEKQATPLGAGRGALGAERENST